MAQKSSYTSVTKSRITVYAEYFLQNLLTKRTFKSIIYATKNATTEKIRKCLL